MEYMAADSSVTPVPLITGDVSNLRNILTLMFNCMIPVVESVAVAIFLPFGLGVTGVSLAVCVHFSSVSGKSIAALGPLPSGVSMPQNNSEAVTFIPEAEELQSYLPCERVVEILAAELWQIVSCDLAGDDWALPGLNLSLKQLKSPLSAISRGDSASRASSLHPQDAFSPHRPG
uniref:Uncharacterized protein n=1 Tax=Coccidioides posadasii RMSCC 3488 TaxID=454284 RepID=A0A0J6FP69_COCPO|nr:hypothetical protein CPAG_07542 [Coccidioides posadasii RMSCC 3488]